jgi:hypothetical protein
MDRSSIWHFRIPARLRSGGVLAAGVALAVLATAGVAVAGDAVPAGPIRACYQPGTPTAALRVVTRQHASCPTGDKQLTWNIVGPQGDPGPQGVQGPTGPQGPAGLSTGVTTGKVATIPIDTGSTPVVVLTAPAVPSSGVYYITASLTVEVAAGDLVACAALPNQIEAQTVQFGPPTANISTPLIDNGALSLSAGQAPSIECIDANSNQATAFLEGSVNATLISSSNGAARSALARPGRFPLKIVTSGK